MRAAAIVSAYYAEPYLEGRLENLLSQTERPRIVVVALQNSPEQAIAARTLGREHDSLLMTDAVPTIYHAWNLGIRAARTEYVTNANADDRLRQDGIATLVKALDDHPQAALVYPDVDIVQDLEGGFDANMQSAGDYDLWLRLAKAGEKLLHIREVLGIYLDRPDSVEHRNPQVGAQETIEARRRYAEPRKTRYAKIGA